jgi:hypothetical protein
VLLEGEGRGWDLTGESMYPVIKAAVAAAAEVGGEAAGELAVKAAAAAAAGAPLWGVVEEGCMGYCSTGEEPGEEEEEKEEEEDALNLPPNSTPPTADVTMLLRVA